MVKQKVSNGYWIEVFKYYLTERKNTIEDGLLVYYNTDFKHIYTWEIKHLCQAITYPESQLRM